jgi:hypothetical protein
VPFHPGDLAPLTAATIFPFEFSSLTVCCAGFRRRTVDKRQRARFFAAGLFTVGMILLTGCGVVTTQPSVHDYTINVTGTSVSFPTQVQTAMSVVLTVGQQ